MIKKSNVLKITCIVSKVISGIVTESLKNAGINNVLLRSGRSIIMKKNSGIKKIINETSFEENPIDLFEFYLNPADEKALINTVVNNAQLYLPARGSIYSQDIELIWDGFSLEELHFPQESQTNSGLIQKNLSGLYTIVHRNQSDPLVKQILALAVSVPIITYGKGTGLRDKLNLLRITIPAEKDMMQIVINSSESENILPYLIKTGRLNEPGKGFIYTSPIRCGVLDSKFFIGTKKNAASIEQIISAIDAMQGKTDWRTHSDILKTKEEDQIKYLYDLSGFTIICNEGYANDIIAEAMKAGAPGATVSKCLYENISGNITNNSITPARESSTLVIPSCLIEKVVEALDKTGYITKAQCVFEITSVPKACTYLG